MWLREYSQLVMQNGFFWFVVFLLFLTQLFLIGAVEQDRIRGRLPKFASTLFVLTLVLPSLSFFAFMVKPFPEPFSQITGFLLLFTGPILIFARAPGHFGFQKPLVWLSRLFVLAYSLLLIIFSAAYPR